VSLAVLGAEILTLSTSSLRYAESVSDREQLPLGRARQPPPRPERPPRGSAPQVPKPSISSTRARGFAWSAAPDQRPEGGRLAVCGSSLPPRGTARNEPAWGHPGTQPAPSAGTMRTRSRPRCAVHTTAGDPPQGGPHWAADEHPRWPCISDSTPTNGKR